MNPGERLLRGSGIAQQVTLRDKPWEWRGIPGWDPAKLGPIPAPAQERAEKYATFARLRSEGLGVHAAAAAMGLPPQTGRWYEPQRKAGAV